MYLRIKADDVKYLPERQYEMDSGLDLKAKGDYVIKPGETVKIDTGIAMALPLHYGGFVFSRSGLSTKGLWLANGVGVIDWEYRGKIYVPLHNISNEEQKIYDGQRIAQLIILAVAFPRIMHVDTLESTNRGINGFGSTGM